MVRLLLAILALVSIGVGGILLTSCESADNAAARRLSEESARARAEAEAYQVRAAADAAAASERASTRQMERDASHERALETLPFVLAIGGGVLVLALGGFVVWDLRGRQMAQPPAAMIDPVMLAYLDRLRLEQVQQWRVLAHVARDGARDVVIYEEGGRHG